MTDKHCADFVKAYSSTSPDRDSATPAALLAIMWLCHCMHKQAVDLNIVHRGGGAQGRGGGVIATRGLLLELPAGALDSTLQPQPATELTLHNALNRLSQATTAALHQPRAGCSSPSM
jgi:hypothetical protein